MITVNCLPERISGSGEETVLLGQTFGNLLEKGDVVALSGPLGAGKTCFVKGIALSLDIDETITSPSYTIASDYEGRLPLRHIDAYRLAGEEDFELIGGSELLSENGVTVIEWPEKIAPFLPAGTYFIKLEILAGSKRIIRFTREHTGL